MSQNVILIPARLASTRLPNKPMAVIGDAPMIVQVWRRAMEANCADVVVACDHESIKRAIEDVGGTAVLTKVDHPSGSDRIYEALQLIDPDGRYEVVINLQGDLPTLDPSLLPILLEPLKDASVDIATLGAAITDEAERDNPSVVKPVIHFYEKERGRALYFTRATAPYGDGPLYHHIGIYAYRREVLARFVAHPPSILEQREKLEQLRALEMNMRIDITIVETQPLGVDTPADLEKARALLCTD